MRLNLVGPLQRWRVGYGRLHERARGAIVFVVLGVIAIQQTCAGGTALNEAWRSTSYGTSDGLPSGQVLAICEAHDGDTWIHTQDGVAWFDGFAWNTVATDLLTERDYVSGTISSAERGVNYCTGGHFYSFTREGCRLIPVAHSGQPVQVHAAFRIPDGGTLIISDSLLYRLAGDSVSLFPLPGPIRAPVPPYYQLRLFETREGLWANSAVGLFRLTGSRWIQRFKTRDCLFNVNGLAENEAGSGILALQLDVSRPAEFYIWQNHGPLIRTEPPQTGYFLSSLDITAQGVIHALLPSGGLMQYEGGRWILFSPPPLPLQGAFLIRSRKNGDLWSATPDGLRLCRLRSTLWTLWQQKEGDQRSYVNGLAQSRDGYIWIATSGGLGRLAPDGTISWTTRVGGQNLDVLTGINVDSSDNIWISSGAAFPGTYRWDRRSWKHFGKKEGLFDTPIHRIAKDRHNHLWFLSIASWSDTTDAASGRGAAWYDGRKFHLITTNDGLLSNRVYAMADGSDGSRWFGSLAGIQRFRDGIWTNWTTVQGLVRDRTFDLALDSSNGTWFTDQYFGIGHLDSTGHLRYYTARDGLVNDAVYGLMVDSAGGLWAMTRGGVGYFYQGTWYALTHQHGLPSGYTWPVLLQGRNVYIGTSGTGLVRLNLAALSLLPPRVRFNSLALDADDPVASWTANAYDGEIPSGIIETRYRIDDATWSSWSRTRSVPLRRLSPGHHSLSVQAKGFLPGAEPPVNTLDVNIPYPPYLRLSFIVPVSFLLILLAVVGWIAAARKQRLVREQRETASRLSRVVDAVTEGITLSDVDGNFRIFNPRFQQLTGYSIDEAKNLDDFFTLVCPDDRDREQLLTAFRQAKSTGLPQEVETTIRSRNGTQLDILVSVTVVRLEDRDYFLTGYRDLTRRVEAERRTMESLREKEVLLKEVHHRVKNNMQVISSLLNLQLYALKDPEMQDVLKASQNRIRSMALIHEKLYQFGQFASVPFHDYLNSLASSILHTYDAGHVALTLDVGDVVISLENAMPCGLIVNEVLTNALKYAFPDKRRGKVAISLRPLDETHLRLMVADDGVGLPADFEVAKAKSLGFQIIQTLSKQIDGTLEIRRDQGTTVVVTFPTRS